MGTRWNGRPRLVSMLARSCLKATGRKRWPQPFGRFFIGGCFLLLLIGAQPAFMGGPLYGMRKGPKCIGVSIKTIPFSNSKIYFFMASVFLEIRGLWCSMLVHACTDECRPRAALDHRVFRDGLSCADGCPSRAALVHRGPHLSITRLSSGALASPSVY